jgi:4-hydroxybutyrate CoA-transferase
MGYKDWKSEYEKKLISAEAAAQFVNSGNRIVFTSGREAFSVGFAIAARLGELKGVKITAPTPTFDFGWYDAGWEDAFEVTIRMPTATCQDAVDAKRCDFDPGSLIPFVEIDESYRADICLTEVSTPDENGFCSFGASLWAKKRQLQQAKLTIAEVNSNLIRPCGENYVHVSEIDYFVEHKSTGRGFGTGSLAGKALKGPEPYLKNVAENVSSLIKDGDTLQIGIGRTTEPLVKLGLLNGKQDIGWHSEATPPGIITLIREGVINGKLKTLHPEKAVVTAIGGGSKEEMDWVNNNPLFYMVDIGYLEDFRTIAALDNFVALNNALAIDITGQISAETIGLRQLGSAGGQIPFVLGQWLSKGGRSITVLPSTAQDGKLSRIMPVLPEGTVVTIQRNCVDYVVTEYGIARLRGKTLRQRAEELISIAHPDHRSELKKAAQARFWPK